MPPEHPILPTRDAVRTLLAEFPEIRGPVRLESHRRDALARALSNDGFVLPFEWAAWSDTAHAMLSDPSRIAAADAETVCRLITVIVRSDRFMAGEIDAALGDGRMGALMARLAALAETWQTG